MLTFIKSHIVIAIISIVTIIGAIVIVPAVINNYQLEKLEKAVESNISMLIQNEDIIEGGVEIPKTNEEEFLTFRIQKVTITDGGSGWMIENGVKTEVNSRKYYRI